MASRMLHYVMARELLQKLEIKDKNCFLVGALLPDASSHQDGSYDVAHFYNEVVFCAEAKGEVPCKGINWRRFAEKYGDILWSNDMCLGYLCHLIMDAVWFHDVADRYVRMYPYPKRRDMYQKGYEDFNRLNVILRKQYGLINPGLKVEAVAIEEVKPELIPLVFDGFESDFAMEGDWKPEDLELYPYEALKRYIEKCRELCVAEIEALKLGKGFVECEQFFSKK